MHFSSLAVCLGLAGLAQAHMEMIYPPPFKSKANPHAGSDVDYSMTAPLDASGANFPCKGYQSLFGTEQGASVANWEAGGSYNMSITGGANHGGGSCQASLSFDKGKTWQVIHSYVGKCPAAGTSSFDFKVPSDAPSGEAIFAWSWFNQIGNREMYMNCAAVTIGGGSGKRASAMSNRPEMFVANVGNGCTTEESADLEFPNPGPDVSNDSQKTAGPKGTCGKAGSGGGSSGGGSGSGNGNGNNGGNDGAAPSTPADGSAGGNNGSGGGSGAAPSAPAVPTQTQPAAQPSAPAAQPSAPAGGAPSAPGGVFVTVSQPAEATGAPAAPSAPANGGGAETSTLLTMTKPAPGTGGQPVPTSVASPEPVPTTPVAPGAGAGEGGSGSGSEEAAGSACTEEGAWNCIGGTKYQRCASGQWSVVQSMAAGTTCSGNKSSAMAFGFGRKLAFRARWV